MTQTKAWHKPAWALATLILALMAAIQYNDPDPLYWILVYGAAAVVTGAAVTGRRMPRFALITLGALIAGMLISVPGFIDYLQSGQWGAIGEHMNDEEPYIEEGRELVGLMMAAAALLPLLRRSG